MCLQTLRMVGLYRISEASVFQFIHSAPKLKYLDITQCDKRTSFLALFTNPVFARVHVHVATLSFALETETMLLHAGDFMCSEPRLK